jgi:hypothetical protein
VPSRTLDTYWLVQTLVVAAFLEYCRRPRNPALVEAAGIVEAEAVQIEAEQTVWRARLA